MHRTVPQTGYAEKSEEKKKKHRTESQIGYVEKTEDSFLTTQLNATPTPKYAVADNVLLLIIKIIKFYSLSPIELRGFSYILRGVLFEVNPRIFQLLGKCSI